MYKIELILSALKTCSYASSNVANVLSHISNLGDRTNQGFKGFFFSGGDANVGSGCWLDGSYRFFDSVNKYAGWIGDTLSNSDGTFSTSQSITATCASNITTLTIIFDKVAGEYAQQITIGNTVYNNYSYICILNLVNSSTSVTVEFTKWSKANSCAKVLAITYGLVIDYDSHNSSGLQYTEQFLTDASSLVFGITLQSGSFTALDKLNQLQQANAVGLLRTGAVVKIYEDDVQVAEMITDDYDSDEVTKEWTISLSDALEPLDEDQFAGLDYASRNLKTIVDILLPGVIYVDDLATELTSITIPESLLEVTSRWDAIVKCCNVGTFVVYLINGVTYARKFL